MGRQRTTKIDEAQASSAPAESVQFSKSQWKPEPRPRRDGAAEPHEGGGWHWLGSHPNAFFQNVAIGPMTFPAYTGFGGGGDLESDTDLAEGVTASVAVQPSDPGLLLPGAVAQLSGEQLRVLERNLDMEVIDLANPAGARMINIQPLRIRRGIEKMIEAMDAGRPFEAADDFERQLALEFAHRDRNGLVSFLTAGSFTTHLDVLGEYRENTMIPAGCFVYLVPLPAAVLELPEGERAMWRPSARLRGWRRFSDGRLPGPLRRMSTAQAVEFRKYLAAQSRKFVAGRIPEKIGSASVEWVGHSWRQQDPFSTPGGYQAYLTQWPPIDESAAAPAPAAPAAEPQEGLPA